LLRERGRDQTLFDYLRDELRAARINAVHDRKVERGKIRDHDEIHEHGQWRIASAFHRIDRHLAREIMREAIDA
jgi:hypothetical protein